MSALGVVRPISWRVSADDQDKGRRRERGEKDEEGDGDKCSRRMTYVDSGSERDVDGPSTV